MKINKRNEWGEGEKKRGRKENRKIEKGEGRKGEKNKGNNDQKYFFKGQ